MQLAPGTYTFTTTAPTVSTVTYVVTAAGIVTTFGVLVWDGVGAYRRGTIGLEVIDGSHFAAINGPENLAGVYAKVG